MMSVTSDHEDYHNQSSKIYYYVECFDWNLYPHQALSMYYSMIIWTLWQKSYKYISCVCSISARGINFNDVNSDINKYNVSYYRSLGLQIPTAVYHIDLQWKNRFYHVIIVQIMQSPKTQTVAKLIDSYNKGRYLKTLGKIKT